jgi:NDP-sugar pyrophosphorylase family protein
LSSPLKVIVTTSGIGSRLGEFTKYTNKSLVKVGHKPVLSRIIDSYPKNTQFVVTLGYKWAHVKEFLEITYPQIDFQFVLVDKYEGNESSLLHSLAHAEEHLQEPFIFHACDTIVSGFNFTNLQTNWVAGKRGVASTNYAGFDSKGKIVSRFHHKGMLDIDFTYVGIAGIKSYKAFWNSLKYVLESEAPQNFLNDLSVLDEMLKSEEIFEINEVVDWHDAGNVESLQRAKRAFEYESTLLEKPTEAVFFIDGYVVKFNADEEVNSKKVNRAKLLTGLVPQIESYSNNFFKYKYVEGEVLSNVSNPEIIENLLHWAEHNLWKSPNKQVQLNFRDDCEEFYINKSRSRIEEFTSTRRIRDEEAIINGKTIPSAQTLLTLAKEVLVCNAVESKFHGDFILDNILALPGDFKLIDWRHEFGKSLEFGDLYYDLSKLNHSLHISHKLINMGLFDLSINGSEISCSTLRTDLSVSMQYKLRNYVELRGLSWLKVEVLTAIIWINMAPLHHHPFDEFLFFYGRLHLWEALSKGQVIDS